MLYATVDPGLSGTGWAIWSNDWKLLKHGVYIPSPKLTIREKQKNIAAFLLATFECNFVERVYIEYPQKFGGVKGEMVADKGDLVKLAALVGFLEGHFNVNDIEAIDVPVVKWKGQMTKMAVINRIKRLLPKVKAKSHDWDAIGIGLYLKGDF